jgi:hypothetical protein
MLLGAETCNDRKGLSSHSDSDRQQSSGNRSRRSLPGTMIDPSFHWHSASIGVTTTSAGLNSAEI